MWYRRCRSLALSTGLAFWATLPLAAQQPGAGDRASGLAVDSALAPRAAPPRPGGRLPVIAPDTPVTVPARQQTDAAAGVAAGAPADTPVVAAGGSTRLYLGLEPIGPVFTYTPPPPPGHDALWLRPRLEDWTSAWAATARANALRQRPTLAFARPSASEVEKAAPAAEDTACCRFLPPLKKDTTRVRNNLLPGAVGEYADIGMRIRGRGELGGAWNKYFPCDPSTPVQCKPTLFPQLKPDVQFGVQVGGTISDRVHVNVDYDQRREFDAANNINVYYEGKENEILQRVEVGDVSIRLPTSRYLTTGIPAGNFGFKATGQVGPLDFQTVFAQQRGDVSKREFRLNGAAGKSAGLVQDASVTLDDVDYVKGQFFWLVDPDSLPGAPGLNPLQMRLTDAAPSRRPSPGTLVLYRDERISPTSQQQIGQLGYFIADAAIPGSTQTHSGYFHRLVAGDDYIVHSSGLWIVLKVPLRADEALAMGYVTATGETVGSIDADTARSTRPVLRLLRAPTSLHQPGFPDWSYEMHSVYRVDASNGVDPSTLGLQVSLGQLSGGKTFTSVGGKQVTYLKLMGLDEQTPTDQLDLYQIYQPANSGGAPTGKVGGTYVFLPALKPFEAPPPVPSAGLSAADAAAALGADANADIYEKQDPVAREAAARFRLNFTYKVKMDGMVSSLSLGALGIREGSEKVYVGEQLLENGKDYTMDYDIGQVTLLNPQSVFGGNPDAQIRATWEQKATFQIASTSIFGLNTRYKLGNRGELNFIGLYQKQGNIMARPELGTEPASIFLGGASGHVDLGGGALDRLFSWVPGLRASGRSAVSLAGEAALSSPNPNTRGAAYVDDFEGGDEFPISFTRGSWKLGSNPLRADGATGILPDTREVSNAMGLVWQDTYLYQGATIGPMALTQIDKAAVVTDRSRNLTTEPVMYLTMGGDSVPGHETARRRWRSITTVLSSTGRDMSRSEYIEFYAEAPAGDTTAALVLDLGRLAEDAYYYDGAGKLNGNYPDGGRWGLGEDDYEANPANHEIWSTTLDDRGLWDQPCKADRVNPIFQLGDVRANCTRSNGLVDSEDLNGDGLIDKSDQSYFRYVVKLDASSPYLVRDVGSTGTGFRLFRVPLRGIHTVSSGTTDATWHSIQDMRITVVDSVGSARKTLEIARMRIVGSRWSKRDLAGLESGLLGTDAVASDTAAFQVGPVSSMTSAEYTSPPGITNELQDPTSAFGLTTQVTNERSLRLAVASLPAKTRAEVYYRYPQQPRSFLNYRQMRIWAVARKGTWGPSGNQRLLIKVGSDPKNYYVYQTRLGATHGGGATQQDWLPEIAIDFNQWFTLRAQAERALVSAPAGTQPLSIWNGPDSTYGIVLEDRARAPNLAAIRELSFAIYNGALGSQPTEVWLDDIRLGGAMTDPGFAGNLSMDVRAGDFLALQGGIASQGPLYRQLAQGASYQRTTDATLTGTAQLGMLAPAGWDLEAPLSFSWGKTALAPQFLYGSDLPADQLTDLRSSGSNRMRLGLTLRRRTPMANPWLGLLVDGVSLRLGYTGSRDGTTSSLAQSSGLDGAFMYDRRPSAREFGIIPGFIEGALKALFPKRLEGTDFFRRLTTARLRWTPEALSFSTAYFNQRSDSYRYQQILQLPTDTLPPTQSFRRGLDNDARLTVRPFESLTASVALSSTRDLLPANRASDQLRVREAINAARGGIGGLDLGWEADRSVSTQVDWRPLIAAWLRPNFSYSTRFRSDRNASNVLVVPADIDSAASLLHQFQADRQVTRALQLDPKGFADALFGPRKRGLLRGLVALLQPMDLSWTSALGSQFDRVPAAAGAGYQLGLGTLDAWRFIGGDTASTANTRNGLRARAGMMLPFGTEMTTTYDGTTTRLLDVAGGRRSDESTTWPALQLSWPRVPLPKMLTSFLTQAGLSAGYQHTTHSNAYGTSLASDAAQPVSTSFLGRGTGEETSIPLQFSMGLLRTVTASYSGTFTTGTASDATGDMRKDGSNQTLSLSGFFKMPSAMRTKFRNPVQATVGLSQQGDHQCRLGADATCTPYIDYLTRRLNLSFDTQLEDLTVGFQMSYNSRKSNIGTLNGSSQFQLGLYGQFNISAGQLPGAGR